jgi:hypothetical protein
MKLVPLSNEQFIDTLPLVPGVVRGPDGLINIKGARSNQSDLRVNAATAADPVTGEFGFRLPIDVIESVETFTNPYSAEFGNFSSGVTQIHTRTGNNRFHFSLQNFFPRPRTRDGSIVGLDAATPRVTVSGPIIRDKMFYVQSFEYKFVRTRVLVDTLPELKNDTKLESFDSFTLGLRSSIHFPPFCNVSIFPEKNSFVGLNTFNAEETTHDFRQRGKFFSVSGERLWAARYWKQLTASKTMAPHHHSNGSGTMFLAPDFNSGGFFNRQDRESTFHQWNSTYSRPNSGLGRHTFVSVQQSNTTPSPAATRTPAESLQQRNNVGTHRFCR